MNVTSSTMGRALPAVVAAVGAALLLAATGTPRGIKEGGTLRVAFLVGNFDTIDPALVNLPSEGQLLAPACGTLLVYPNKPPPAGYRAVPSLAEAEPVVSRDGRMYTFTIRKDARFSDGKPVTAHAFARALDRVRDPAMESLDASAFQDVRDVDAKGRTLTLRLSKRPLYLLDDITALCAVPPNLTADPEGARAPLPSAGPYYVSEYVPGERLVLERNRFYRGERPHHVDRITADLAAGIGAAVDQVADGTFDYVMPPINATQTEDLARRYGVNKPGGQFFVRAGAGVRVFFLNTSQPLFRKNPKLRQAVNFAVDRKAIAREAGLYAETTTDQYLLPDTPGYRDEPIYPRKRPDLKRARSLAKGRTRGGKAVLYTTTRPEDISQAQILQKNLRAIGLELEIKQLAGTLQDKLRTPGEPFDLGRARLFTSPDPTLLHIFDGRTIGQSGSVNFSYFDSPKYNRLLDQASHLTGAARYRAYGELDVMLSRDAAPAIPISVVNALAFVSKRTGCVVMNPFLDLTAVCLK
jgi:ABC-type transport system substrate-binding protein